MRAPIVTVALLLAATRLDGQAVARPGFLPLGAETTSAALDAPVTMAVTAPLREVIAQIVAQANLSVAFDDSLPGLDHRATVRVQRVPARTALARALDDSPLQALVSPSGQVVLVRRPARPVRAARLSGTIRDADGGAPVAGARVEIVGTRFSAYSRDSGDFALQLPLGDYVVRVTRLGYEPLTMPPSRVSDDDSRDPLRILLRRAPPSLSEIVVTPGYFGLLQSTLNTPQALSREQLETIPQIGEDIYRAVSGLPGVSADDFSAKFSVRGGSGDELYVSLDGLELVEPFHLKDVGGAFSIIDIQALGTAALTTGGFSAEYGDRLTGVFTLATSDPRTDRVRTSVGVSLMNARVTSQGGFAAGKGGWLVSARPGFLDLALKFTDIRDSIKPRYYDLFAKAQYDLGRGGRVAVHALHANDNFRYIARNEPNIFSTYRSTYAWLTWDDKVGSRLRQKSVLSAGALNWQRTGESAVRGVQNARINDARSFDRLAARQDWLFDISSRLLLKWGLDAKREAASYDYFSAVDVSGRNGIPSAALDTTAAAAEPRTNKMAVYFAPRVQLLPSLTLEVGVRHDWNTHLGESITSPRVNLSWEPRLGTTVRAAWGRYSQSQALFGLQSQDGVSTFAPARRAEQRILGIEQSLPFGITGRLEGYERRATNGSTEFANVGGDILLFPELSWDRVQINRTAGHDRGLELQASRRTGGRVDWSASYALASSIDSIGGKAVQRSMDQRHAIHLDWSVRPASSAWRFSVGGVWHSGWPYTPTNFLVDTLVNTPTKFSLAVRRQPGELNSLRLRSYRRVDVRWTKYFDRADGRISIFGEVYNLFGTKNPRGIFKSLRVSGRNTIVHTEEIDQWPRLPIAGFTWEF